MMLAALGTNKVIHSDLKYYDAGCCGNKQGHTFWSEILWCWLLWEQTRSYILIWNIMMLAALGTNKVIHSDLKYYDAGCFGNKQGHTFWSEILWCWLLWEQTRSYTLIWNIMMLAAVGTNKVIHSDLKYYDAGCFGHKQGHTLWFCSSATLDCKSHLQKYQIAKWYLIWNQWKYPTNSAQQGLKHVALLERVSKQHIKQTKKHKSTFTYLKNFWGRGKKTSATSQIHWNYRLSQKTSKKLVFNTFQGFSKILTLSIKYISKHLQDFILTLWGSDLWNIAVLGLEYSGTIRSIPLLLMPWLLVSPGHQQPWYWLYKNNGSGFHLPVPYRY